MARVSCECDHLQQTSWLSDNFLSMDSTVRLLARCVDIVDLKYDLIRFNAEKDRSHSAVLTTIVSESCRSLTKLGKAALKGMTATNTSLMVSSSCPLSAKVRLASTHSILSRSLSIKPYDSTNGISLSLSRNSKDKGLQLCTAFIRSTFLLSNCFLISDSILSKIG